MREPRILKVLEKYRAKNLRVPIIVEGRNDVNMLRRLDFRGGEIITMNSGNSLVAFTEEVAKEFREVIILTDFDRRGGRQMRVEFERLFVSLGVHADTYLWEFLYRSGGIRSVEELGYAQEKAKQRLLQQ